MSISRYLVVLPALLLVSLASLCGDSPASAQQLPSYPVSFLKVEDEQDNDDEDNQDEERSLAEQLEEMKVRLEELEYDVQKKIAADAAAEKSADAGERVAARLDALEKSVETNHESIAGIDDQIPGFVVHSHKRPRMSFFGRMHLDWWAFPRAQPGINAFAGNPEDRVEFRRLRLGVAGDLNDNMFYRLEAEFGDRRLRTAYRDAFIGFRNTPLLNTVLIGNHKRPYGLDHLNDSNFNIFMERPFIVQAFNEDSRRLGISSNGYNKNRTMNWRYGFWHQGLTQNDVGFISDHYQPELAGRLAFTPWFDETSGGRGYFHFGVSGSFGWPDGSTAGSGNAARYRTRAESRHRTRWLDTGSIFGADGNNVFGLESVFNVGPFQLSGEYMTVGVNRADAVGPILRFDGGYIQAAWMLTGEHVPWNRQWGVIDRVTPFENFFSVRDCDGNVKRGLGAWQIAARYSWADLSDQDIIGGQADSFTMAANWYWNPYARMQFNYILGEINRPPQTDPGGEYSAVGVRFMVDF